MDSGMFPNYYERRQVILFVSKQEFFLVPIFAHSNKEKFSGKLLCFAIFDHLTLLHKCTSGKLLVSLGNFLLNIKGDKQYDISNVEQSLILSTSKWAFSFKQVLLCETHV